MAVITLFLNTAQRNLKCSCQRVQTIKMKWSQPISQEKDTLGAIAPVPSPWKFDVVTLKTIMFKYFSLALGDCSLEIC